MTNVNQIVAKKETKTVKRLFRFTKTNFDRLEFLKTRYNTNISDVVDLLIEASSDPAIQTVLDGIVEQSRPHHTK